MEPESGRLRNFDHTPVEGLLPIDSWQPGTWVRDRCENFVSPRWATGDVDPWGGVYAGSERMKLVAD